MNQSQSNIKNNCGSFWIEYFNGSHDELLNKFKGDISKLNVEIVKTLFDYIEKNKNSSYVKTRKKVYLNAKQNEDLAQFCNSKEISKPELADLIKNEILNRYI